MNYEGMAGLVYAPLGHNLIKPSVSRILKPTQDLFVNVWSSIADTF